MPQIGLHERYEPTMRERHQFAESERFLALCDQADKRKLWALITGWDNKTDKSAVWCGNELIG